MVKKKNKISVENSFDNIRIIGITTHLQDYQLAWNLNKELNINLIKYEDIMNEQGQFFSFYLYNAGENSNAYNLVSIINEETKWVKLKYPTDYVFIVRNFITDDKFQQIISKIKQINDVAMSYLIDIAQINKTDNTMLECIEFHECNLMDQMRKEEKSKETGEYWFSQSSGSGLF